jgi:hypothetical protein
MSNVQRPFGFAAPGISPLLAKSCNARTDKPLMRDASAVPTRSIANAAGDFRLAPIAGLRLD